MATDATGQNLGTASRASRQRGTALIEFAFVLPFLFVLTFTMIDLSRAFYIKSMITAAAREGVRVAAVTGDPAGGGYTTVRDRVRAVLQSSGIDTVSVSVSTLGPQLHP